MPTSKPGYWFTSTLFEAEPGEDDESNPRMYGRQPAKWLREGFLALGYPAEEVFGEDWGWCVMYQREPYSLFVGCLNLRDYEFAREGDPPPPKALLLWNATPFAEVPFFKYAFRRKPDVSAGLAKLDDDLRALLQNEPTVSMVNSVASAHWFEDTRRMAANDQR
jgi:hypothetical protein